MAAHERFHYQSLEEIQAQARALHTDLNFASDLSPLARPVKVGSKTAPNSFAVLPMEGCDSNPDGSPSELVTRRYTRFAAGGSGLLWWEACAVTDEGRANELSMMLTKDNVGAFARLVDTARKAASDANGADHKPLHILQLTHSGRYSRPVGHSPAPIVPQHDPILDPRVGLFPDAPVITDGYLDDLIGQNENVPDILQSGNRMIDIILNGRLAAAKAAGIDVEILSAQAPETLPMRDADLCSLMLNLIDNAIAAAKAPDVRRAYIRLELRVKDHYFIFACENGCSPTPSGHGNGLGLKIVESIVERYDCLMEIERSEDAFKAAAAIPTD